MKVLVAGASGAVGRPLVRRLEQSGHEVIAASRSSASAPMDALDAGSVDEAVGAARPEVIVNQLTAIPDPIDPRRMEKQFEPTNRLRREGTANLIAAAKAHGVRRMVSQSIAFAYAPTGHGAWTEEDRLFSEAGEIIRAVEALEQQTLAAEGVEGVVLRYGFFYGPGTTYAPDGGTALAVRKRQFPIIGKGTGVFCFIHVDDAAAATVAAVERGAPGIYNIVDDVPHRFASTCPRSPRCSERSGPSACRSSSGGWRPAAWSSTTQRHCSRRRTRRRSASLAGSPAGPAGARASARPWVRSSP